VFTECGLSDERTPVGKEFHARGPATQKAFSLRRRLVRGRLKSPRELASVRTAFTEFSEVDWCCAVLNVKHQRASRPFRPPLAMPLTNIGSGARP